MQDSEQQLIQSAQSGELSAFNSLVERYQTPLFNLCLRLLGSREAAEDAAQEAFLSAYRSLHRFHGGNFRAWLYRIASNACYDELRRRRVRPSTSLDAPTPDETGWDPPDKAPTMDDHVQTQELSAHIQQALVALPYDQRLAVTLCDVIGLSYEEIAATTDSSLGTVKSRISRGRGRLRQILLANRELLPDRFRQNK